MAAGSSARFSTYVNRLYESQCMTDDRQSVGHDGVISTARAVTEDCAMRL